jgi:ABC-type nitrate/sulfonate/bicarbonate transport system ATPase subunit
LKIAINQLTQAFPLSRATNLSVLAGINLQIAAGCFTVILGESGCGKSTLLNLVAGLLPPTAGEILADGQRVSGPGPERSILFQQPSLLPWLTVADNIAFGCRLRGEMEDLPGRVEQLIRMIGLQGFADRYPAELSLGMAQRVCLARALIGKPKALLLDEPFGALDICNRIRLQSELLRIWQRERFTALLVTHDIDEALVVGQQIVVLGGRPTTILSAHAVDLPYPRDITSPSFFATRRLLLQELQAATTLEAVAL